MSRIGKLPVKVPSDVEVNFTNSNLVVKGKFGELTQFIPDSMELIQKNGQLTIHPKENNKNNRSLHGLYRSLINNMVIGVTKQFKICLLLQGVGYRATVQSNKLVLNLGYSHHVELIIPNGIKVNVVKSTTLNLESCEKEKIGLFASQIRSWRPPEPYKGKGILYEGEIVKRKAGKSGKK